MRLASRARGDTLMVFPPEKGREGAAAMVDHTASSA